MGWGCTSENAQTSKLNKYGFRWGCKNRGAEKAQETGTPPGAATGEISLHNIMRAISESRTAFEVKIDTLASDVTLLRAEFNKISSSVSYREYPKR